MTLEAQNGMYPNDDDREVIAGQWCLRMAEGALSDAQMAEFLAWIGEDPENQRCFDSVSAMWSALGEESTSPEMIIHRQKALRYVRQAEAKQTHLGRWRTLSAAAALILVLAGGTWLAQRPTLYETHVGERRVILLEDGSRLSLDADTRVRVRYAFNRRDLTLERGRANFTVAHDTKRPFAVTSGEKIVVATGTAFSVERLKDEVRVILYEGHVNVFTRAPGGDRAPQMVAAPTGVRAAEKLLKPGTQLILPENASIGQLATVEETTPRSWEGGQLEFSNDRLESAAERMNRYASGRRIVVTPDVAALRVSGTFNAGDTEAFARTTAGVFQIGRAHV